MMPRAAAFDDGINRDLISAAYCVAFAASFRIRCKRFQLVESV